MIEFQFNVVSKKTGIYIPALLDDDAFFIKPVRLVVWYNFIIVTIETAS